MQMELLSSESLNSQTDVKASIPTQHKRAPGLGLQWESREGSVGLFDANGQLDSLFWC